MSEKHGTAENEYMHESIEKDAVKYDLTSEEMIEALCHDNKALQSDLAKLKQTIDCSSMDYIRKLESALTAKDKRIASLEEALEKYGEHRVGCFYKMKKNGWSGFKCECGFEQAKEV